jgi:general transcriptional corepressor CYC8
VRPSESPRPTPAPEQKERRRRGAGTREKEAEASLSGSGVHLQEQQQQMPPAKKERKKRTTNKRAKEEQQQARNETPKSFGGERGGGLSGPGSGGSFKLGYGKGSPEPGSSNASRSSRSMQPSPTSVTPQAPSRVVDEDYDEGVEGLMGLATEASYRAPETSGGVEVATRSPNGSRQHGMREMSPPPRGVGGHLAHRESVSSTRSHASASSSSHTGSLKRALSTGLDEVDRDSNGSGGKRMRIRRASPPPPPPLAAAGVGGGGRRSPLPSTRPSPIPFRTQATPATHSPESLPRAGGQHEGYPPSSPLPAVLPPHPRPIGTGTGLVSGASVGGGGGGGVGIALPPIATLSPRSTSGAPSPSGGPGDREERMRGSGSRSRSVSPPHGHGKHTPSPPLNLRDKMDTS